MFCRIQPKFSEQKQSKQRTPFVELQEGGGLSLTGLDCQSPSVSWGFLPPSPTHTPTTNGQFETWLSGHITAGYASQLRLQPFCKGRIPKRWEVDQKDSNLNVGACVGTHAQKNTFLVLKWHCKLHTVQIYWSFSPLSLFFSFLLLILITIPHMLLTKIWKSLKGNNI